MGDGASPTFFSLGAVALVLGAAGACTSLDGLSGSSDGDAGSPADGASGTGTSDGALPVTDGSAPDVEADCARYATELCARNVACRPAYVQQLYGGPLVCNDRMKDQCLVSARAPGSRSAASLAKCAAVLPTATCGQIIDGAWPADCVPPGERADGSPCVSDLQCRGLVCSARNGSGCGTCATRAALGADCGSGCVNGLVCANGKCADPSSIGALCSDTAPCDGDLQCRGGGCTKLGDANAPCDGANLCNTGKGLICDTTSSQCLPQTSITPGTVCTANTLCTGGLCGPGAPPAPQPTCLAWVTPGGACGGGPPPKMCMMPLQCVAGQCLLPDMKLCN